MVCGSWDKSDKDRWILHPQRTLTWSSPLNIFECLSLFLLLFPRKTFKEKLSPCKSTSTLNLKSLVKTYVKQHWSICFIFRPQCFVLLLVTIWKLSAFLNHCDCVNVYFSLVSFCSQKMWQEEGGYGSHCRVGLCPTVLDALKTVKLLKNCQYEQILTLTLWGHSALVKQWDMTPHANFIFSQTQIMETWQKINCLGCKHRFMKR